MSATRSTSDFRVDFLLHSALRSHVCGQSACPASEGISHYFLMTDQAIAPREQVAPAFDLNIPLVDSLSSIDTNEVRAIQEALSISRAQGEDLIRESGGVLSSRIHTAIERLVTDSVPLPNPPAPSPDLVVLSSAPTQQLTPQGKETGRPRKRARKASLQTLPKSPTRTHSGDRLHTISTNTPASTGALKFTRIGKTKF